MGNNTMSSRRSDKVMLEPLDVGRFWGVFEAEGYSPDPLALFRSQESAAEWLETERANGELGGCDFCILPVWIASGEVANHAIDSEAIDALEAKYGGSWQP